MRAPVYRHLERSQSWLGLEPVDAVALGALLWLLLTFHRGAFLINLAISAAAYLALRVAKRGKPPGYTLTLLRYALRPRRAFLTAAPLSAPTDPLYQPIPSPSHQKDPTHAP